MYQNLSDDLKSRIDVLTAFRTRILSAANLVHETIFLYVVQEVVFEINVNLKDLSMCTLSM